MSASVGSVEAYAPARAPFSSTTKPSASQVFQLLQDAAADVAGVVVRAGYDWPIDPTATLALRQVDSAVAQCAWALVESTAPTRDTDSLKAAQKMCEAAQKMIADGQLPGINKNAAESRPRAGYNATAAYITKGMCL